MLFNLAWILDSDIYEAFGWRFAHIFAEPRVSKDINYMK